MRPARSSVGAAGLGQLGGQRRRLHAGRPHRGVGVDAGASRRPCRATSTPLASTPTTRAPMRSSTPRRSSSLVALPESSSPNVASGSLAAVEQQHPDRRSDRTCGTRRSGERVASSRIWPASSTPVGPAPTTTIVSQRSLLDRVGRRLGHLEGAEDAPAELQGVVDRLHARRMEGQLVVAEVRLAGAGGDDQAVVGQLDRAQVGGRRGVDDAARRDRSRSPRRAPTRTLSERRTTWRIGGAIWPGDSMPVATWYSSGWNRWWLRRSTSVTSTGSWPRSRSASSPPKPPPTTTTRVASSPVHLAVGRSTSATSPERLDVAHSDPGLECMMPPSAKTVVAVR